MALTGKGMMIWKIPSCEGGNASAIASTAAAAGFSHVLIKIANDTRPYNVDASGKDLVAPVVDALRAKGIQVWGWHYVYGNDPTGEANKAVQRVQETAVAGHVIDAEAESDLPGKAAAATTFMSLSPRPERQTAIIWFRSKDLASLAA